MGRMKAWRAYGSGRRSYRNAWFAGSVDIGNTRSKIRLQLG